jgi:uncharacterized surface protein with fasciclin (FAS1) repeats
MIMLNRVLWGMLIASGLTVGAMAAQPVDPEAFEPETFAGEAELLATLTANPQLEEFAAAIQQAFGDDFDARFDSAEEWTVFAPWNDAMEYPHTLHTEETAVTYFVRGLYTYQDLWELAEGAGGSAVLTTLDGEELTVVIEDGTLRIAGVAQIQTQHRAANAIIHVIDSLLEAPVESEAGG